MEIKKAILFRVGTVYVIVFLGVLLILGKVLYVQFVEGEMWRAEAEKVVLQKRVIPANRGDILATDLRPLASSVPSFTVAIDPNTELDPDIFRAELPALAKQLSLLFTDRSATQYAQKIRSAKESGSRYLILRRKVSYAEMMQLKEFPLFRLGRFQGGLILEQSNSRVNPYALLAKRTLGYISESEKGTTVGIEGAFDFYLKGRDGLRNLHKVRGGNWVPLSTQNEIDPRDGTDVVTCINIDYQDVAEKALYDLLKVHNAHHGCAILMEVKTGEIRAIANLGQADDGEYYELKNYAIWERTEPGSTFKLPAIMAAFEDGYIKMDDTINTFKGQFAFADRKIYDSHAGGFGILSVAEVFEKSSNIGMARIIDRYYKDKPERFVNRLYSMGLKNPTGVEIEGEQDPFIKNPDDKDWSRVTLPFMAHGYELLMTPLQILSFYNAVANDGKYVQPRLVKGLRNHSHMVKEFKPVTLKHSICSDETLDIAHQLLEGVVERGTATNLKSDNYSLAGKTGTAVIARGDQGYKALDGKKDYRASFVGYFPADRPKYSCIVVITRPNMGVYYGNRVAGNVFREIADKVMATDIELSLQQGLLTVEGTQQFYPVPGPGDYLAIKTIAQALKLPIHENGKIKAYAQVSIANQKIQLEELSWREGTVPDVMGMGLMDALPLLENNGYLVRSKGQGKVLKQSVEPGSEVPRGSTIILNLGGS